MNIFESELRNKLKKLKQTETILVCGSRVWDDYPRASNVLDLLSPLTIIEGGAKGADLHANTYAHTRQIKCRTFQADWKRYGKGAGPLRNKLMLSERPDLVLAFHDFIGESKGTKNMLLQALHSNYSTLLVTSTYSYLNSEIEELLKD